MSKYGFNANEIRKEIFDLIDKDGFHEKHIFYEEPSPAIKTASVEIKNNLGEQQLSVSMVEIVTDDGVDDFQLKVSTKDIAADGSVSFYPVPLFNGKYTLNPNNFSPLMQFGNNVLPEITGSAKVTTDSIEIYGDCTITLNGTFS